MIRISEIEVGDRAVRRIGLGVDVREEIVTVTRKTAHTVTARASVDAPSSTYRARRDGSIYELERVTPEVEARVEARRLRRHVDEHVYRIQRILVNARAGHHTAPSLATLQIVERLLARVRAALEGSCG